MPLVQRESILALALFVSILAGCFPGGAGSDLTGKPVQIWTALIAMLLVRYLQFKSRLGWHLPNRVGLLRLKLFTYRDLWSWIQDPFQDRDSRSPQ